MIRFLRRRRYEAGLAAAKQWQAQERTAAVGWIIALAPTTPDPVRSKR